MEFEEIIKKVVKRTEINLDYAKKCGELAVEMGVEYDDCPYDKDSHEFVVWCIAFRDAVNNRSKLQHIANYRSRPTPLALKL